MKYLVHIGYSKAASTFLQKKLFAGEHPELKPLEFQEGQRAYKPGKNLFDQSYFAPDGSKVKTITPFFFDKERVLKLIEQNTPDNAKVTCLSNEGWVGHPFSGGIAAKIYAERIKSALPNAKILIIIRKQEDMCLSLYADALERFDKAVSIDSFLHLPQQSMIPGPNPLYFCFDELISHYVELFGNENVLVLPFELISRKGGSFFLNEICRFVDVKSVEVQDNLKEENKRDYKKYVLFKKLRILNMISATHPTLDRPAIDIPGLRKGVVNILSPFVKAHESVKQSDLDNLRRHLSPYIAASNSKLQNYTEHDLEALGYTMNEQRQSA